MIMLDTCENCYEEAVLVKAQGMQVCNSCQQDMGGEFEDDTFLMDTNDMVGVMSDDDVIDMFKNEYVGY